MDKMTIYEKNNRIRIRRAWYLAVFSLIIITSFLFNERSAYAAETSITISEINYYDSTITLQANTGDTTIYFSDSAKKKWTAIPGQPDSNGKITMDISWVSASKNYIMTFKGDYSTNIVYVTLPKQETKFKASFNKLKGTITFSNEGTRAIEWRKKDITVWHSLSKDTLAADLSYYFNNGAQLIYRLAPVNGTGALNPGLRASNEVTVTIAKKTAAPNVAINGSKFNIPVKKGMAYRTVNSDGTVTDWVNIYSNTELLLSSVAPEALYNSSGLPQKEVILQFRTNASTYSQVSNISTLIVPVQKQAPKEETYGITLEYTSSTSMALTVKSASTTMPFEYTIIQKDKVLDYKTAYWKPITSGLAVNISSTAAPAGSHIYVRMKSIEASDTTSFSLASVETDVTGVNGVSYPAASQATQLTTLVSTAGVCKTETASSYLTFILYSPTSATVSSIDFYDAYGVNKGSVTCKSTVTLNSGRTGDNDKYIITTRITSTDSVNSFTGQVLYANITLSNQEIIRSTQTTGVLLYLYPRTVINNPEGEDYSDDFERIYMSNDPKDASSFKFQLDFGSDKVIDPSGIDKYTASATAISSIQYNGYNLVNGTDFSVVYGSYVNSESRTVAIATVTVNVANMEKSVSLKTGQALPLLIRLNNNETISNSVFITMIATAAMDHIPIAWSITEGSLPEKTSTTVKNEDGTTTTTIQDVVTYTITLTLFSSAYDVSVSNVTWGGVSIFGSASVSQGKATIYLSNAKINKLVTNSTDTKNIVITLSNGYVIDSGCKLTIINAD